MHAKQIYRHLNNIKLEKIVEPLILLLWFNIVFLFVHLQMNATFKCLHSSGIGYVIISAKNIPGDRASYINIYFYYMSKYCKLDRITKPEK